MVITKQKGNKRQTNTKRKSAQVGDQKFCAPWESVTENWAFKLKTLLSESIFLVTRGQLLIKCKNVSGATCRNPIITLVVLQQSNGFPDRFVLWKELLFERDLHLENWYLKQIAV